MNATHSVLARDDGRPRPLLRRQNNEWCRVLM
jgi:hypothetical protein